MKKASSDYKKVSTMETKPWTKNEKVATGSYKSYNRIEKSFILISAATDDDAALLQP